MTNEPSYSLPDEMDLSATMEGESPHHGFRGHPEMPDMPGVPRSLTIAISRESGSRGASIAKRVGDKLGWQVYTQELLEYIAQEGTFRQDLANQLSAAGRGWVEEQFNRLLRQQNLSRNPSILEMARTILGLGSQGDVILLGRGAGCILPSHTTLHVRLVAPLVDRNAYMSQLLRLTEDEAAEHVRQRDTSRAEFLATHFHRRADDVHQYDMLLNTSLLGEELSADLILTAALAKRAALQRTE